MIVLVNLGEKNDLSMRSVHMFDRSVSYRLGAETYSVRLYSRNGPDKGGRYCECMSLRTYLDFHLVCR
jgi:hypothetical protein